MLTSEQKADFAAATGKLGKIFGEMNFSPKPLDDIAVARTALATIGGILTQIETSLLAPPKRCRIGCNISGNQFAYIGTAHLMVDRKLSSDPIYASVWNKPDMVAPVDARGYPTAIPTGAYQLGFLFPTDGSANGIQQRYVIVTNKPDIAFADANQVTSLSKPGFFVFDPYQYAKSETTWSYAACTISRLDTPFKPGEDMFVFRWDRVADGQAGKRYDAQVFNKDKRFVGRRYMDGLHTNSNPWSTFSAMPRAGCFSYNPYHGAMPVEVCCQISNDYQDEAAHMPIPHLLDDASVTKYATIIRDTLKTAVWDAANSNEAGWHFDAAFNQGIYYNQIGTAPAFMRKFSYPITASILNGTLIVTGIPAGKKIWMYDDVMDGGVAAGTIIGDQILGPPGGAGQYKLNVRLNDGTNNFIPSTQTLSSRAINMVPGASRPLQAYGYQSAQRAALVAKVFAGKRDRVRNIIGYQFSVPDDMDRKAGVLQWARENGVNATAIGDTEIDAFEVAYYWGIPAENDVDRAAITALAKQGKGGLAALFKMLLTGEGLTTNVNYRSVQSICAVFDQWGAFGQREKLVGIGYEGGPAMPILGYTAEQKPYIQDARDLMHEDDRMAEMAGAVHDSLSKNGFVFEYQMADFGSHISDGGDWYVTQTPYSPENGYSRWIAQTNGVTVPA